MICPYCNFSIAELVESPEMTELSVHEYYFDADNLEPLKYGSEYSPVVQDSYLDSNLICPGCWRYIIIKREKISEHHYYIPTSLVGTYNVHPAADRKDLSVDNHIKD